MKLALPQLPQLSFSLGQKYRPLIGLDITTSSIKLIELAGTAGQFRVDDGGYLVNLEGLRVQGYSADQTGQVLGQLGDLLVGNAAIQAQPSTSVELRGNLKSDAVVGPAFDPLTPDTTSNYRSSVRLFDSIGKAHNGDVYCRKASPSNWEFFAVTDGINVQGGTPGQITQIANLINAVMCVPCPCIP